MGHALSIAQGVALAQPSRRVWCIDGDGALLMHMGSLTSTAGLSLHNLVHVVLNNACHESVGGQLTCASQARERETRASIFGDSARAAGYANVYHVSNEKEMTDFAGIIASTTGSTFVEITTGTDSALNKRLPRPTETLAQLKTDACHFLQARDAP